jgi:hypothetical protein
VRIRRITSHALQAIAEGSIIAMLVVGLMAGTAFAGKPGSGTPSGSCSVDPGQVAVAADWTATAWNLGPNRIVNVLVSDSMGTTAFNLASNADGWLDLTWHSYWPGQSTIKVNALSGRKTVLVATCTFEVY